MSIEESHQAMDAECELEEIKTRFIERATMSDMEEIIAQTVDVLGYEPYHTESMFHFKAVRTCDLENSAGHAIKFHNIMMALYLRYHDDAIQEELGEWIRKQQSEG